MRSKKKDKFKMTRRQVLKAGIIGGAGLMMPLRFLPAKAFANNGGTACVRLGGEAEGCTIFSLSDPSKQPKFVELAPNALDPGFLYKDLNPGFPGPVQKPNFSIRVAEITQQTGLIDPKNGRRLDTKLWGYGNDTVSWPGQTIQVMSSSAGGGDPETVVRWENELQGKKHLLPVDTSLHWCYSLPGYENYSIKKNGVPIITHLHGGHSEFQFDGNPEFFYSPDGTINGPQWDAVPGGFTNTFSYDNAVPAGNLWYHDHALGITRLSVYAGLAGFYFVRDSFDTGLPGNDATLPAFPYELAYAIQDRMFTDKGALFYPAFPGDPYYQGFIIDEEADVCPPDTEGAPCLDPTEPTALAEFFGDHMVVNGKIWPKENVEPRNYRMHLLNGTDSRFMAIRFRVAATPTSDVGVDPPLPFYVVGSDQGLASSATLIEPNFDGSGGFLLSEPGSRYDIVFDFGATGLDGQRIIMENIGGDEPFGGEIPGPPVFEFTDRIMAFDVVLNDNDATDAAGLDPQTDDFDPEAIQVPSTVPAPTLNVPIRQVALFEGKDEFGRLQPLLGANTAEPGETPVWSAIPWHSPTTETPTLGTTEEWEIYNFTGDAHPVHLHLVHFEILGRNAITFDSDEGDPGQEVPQHNGEIGVAPVITNVVVGDQVNLGSADGYVENAPKDMVTALPEQVTRIKATFDREGRYVWHCHILSHEDHEMMRVLQVLPAP